MPRYLKRKAYKKRMMTAITQVVKHCRKETHKVQGNEKVCKTQKQRKLWQAQKLSDKVTQKEN